MFQVDGILSSIKPLFLRFVCILFTEMISNGKHLTSETFRWRAYNWPKGQERWHFHTFNIFYNYA